jgi:hypothetical protein
VKGEFLNFARCGLRKLVNEAPMTRFLESRKMLAAVRDRTFFARLPCHGGTNECDNNFAPGIVRDADHGSVTNQRMGEQKILDLARINVLSPSSTRVTAALYPIAYGAGPRKTTGATSPGPALASPPGTV